MCVCLFLLRVGKYKECVDKDEEVVLHVLHYVSTECIHFHAYSPTHCFLCKEQRIYLERPYSNWKKGRPGNKATVLAYARRPNLHMYILVIHMELQYKL